MSSTMYANAYPRKRLFIEMFIRDIAFEDCILDLIDNSIDGYVRSHNINLARTLVDLATGSPEAAPDGSIAVTYSSDEFVIRDNCGGIDFKLAQQEIFNFGHASDHSPDHTALGVYGIGMKRALFKIGRHFRVESRTPRRGFVVDQNLDEWMEHDDKIEDWRFKMKEVAGDSSGRGFTEIRITQIRPEIKTRLKDNTFQRLIYKLISQAYALFLGRQVNVTVNSEVVEPSFIPIGEDDKAKVGFKRFTEGGVSVQLLAGLAVRGERGEWQAEKAGWYVACNGRMVLFADKTELSGWGSLFSAFVSKYRGFVGVAFFLSDDPLKLPWTTTKRGINRESEIFLAARNEMLALSRPVLRFLDQMYQKDDPGEKHSRDVADRVKKVDVKALTAREDSLFVSDVRKSKRAEVTRIQYDVDSRLLTAVKKHIGKPLSPNKIGLHTFDYFVEAEGVE